MSKRKRYSAVASARRTQASAVSAARASSFWTPFETYNDLPAPSRADALVGLGIDEADPTVRGVLTKSHFVIPGKTRLECQRCGECCRYARKVAQLTYEPCPHLATDNTCAKHEDRYLVCRWFPFWVYRDARLGELLTIKPYCSGYGKGALVDCAAVQRRLTELEAAQAADDDGAFVIHEVLMIPGRKDWAFPSRGNVDALMLHIQNESQQPAHAEAREPAPASAGEREGEVHFAHHQTSGLLGSIHSPLLTVTQDGLITDANAEGCALLMRERSAVVGARVGSFFVNPERVEASLALCFAHGKETASPQRLRLPDESTGPVLLNGVTFRDRSDGLVHGVLISVNAVPGPVWREVNQSQTYARGLLEASLDALVVIDHDGVITDVNETVVALSGRSRDALVGLPFEDLFVCRDKAKDGIERTFATGSVRNYELTLLATDGQQIPVAFNATVYRDGDGVVQGVFAAARDIRERLKMIHELKESKDQAGELIDRCLDLLAAVDREGRLSDGNRVAMEALVGRAREMRGR